MMSRSLDAVPFAAVPAASQTAGGDIRPLALALADDLELLAILHDREPTEALLLALRRAPIEAQLALRLTTSVSHAALTAFSAALADIPADCDAQTLDALAAGYADVYLRHAYRAMPTESVWLTEDGLDRQGPMLAVREAHRRHGLRMTDWNNRPEDHLVAQLRFLSALAERAEDARQLEPVVRFLDDHLLRWIHLFAARLVEVDAPPLFAAMAVLTACYLDEARAHLHAVTGIALPPRIVEPAPPAIEALPTARAPRVRVTRKASDQEDRPYVPGVAPSW